MFTNLIEEEKSIVKNRNSEKFNWFKNEEGRIFFIENNTGKKRFGRLINCAQCNSQICIRLNEKVKYCSRECACIASKVKRLVLTCSFCKKDILRTKTRLQRSKKGFYFCDRKCKEKAQQIGGIPEIQPSHYGDGTPSYAERAFRHYGEKCIDCDVTFKPLLEVHHIDGNRDNADIENLEVVCKNHHLLRHLRFNKKLSTWTLNYKFLTPRDMLKSIMVMKDS